LEGGEGAQRADEGGLLTLLSSGGLSERRHSVNPRCYHADPGSHIGVQKI